MSYKKEERLLTVENLSLSFKDKVVLRDINFSIDNITRPDVHQGQVVALLGLSGSGKTQLFRCIAGLQTPTTGSITMNPEKVPVVAGQVGVVQQSYPLLQHRTVWSNLMLAAHDSAKKPHAEKLLIHFGLLDKRDSYPIELSGGQRQRVAIVQQLIASDKFLLMDEPFSGLDIVAKNRVYETIREVSLSHEHNTTIFTTHDLESAVALADTIIVLGHEKDKPGSTIRAIFDLAQEGLAWQPDIEHHPQFWSTVDRLKTLFKSL